MELNFPHCAEISQPSDDEDCGRWSCSRGNMCWYYQSKHISPTVSLGNGARFVAAY